MPDTPQLVSAHGQRLKVLAAGIIISLLLLIGGSIELASAYRATLEQGYNQARLDSMLFAEWMQQELREVELLQNMLSEQLEEQDFIISSGPQRNALESRLVHAMRGVPQAYDIMLVDRHCQLVLSFKVSPGFDASESSYCKAMLAPTRDDRFVSTRFRNASGDDVVVATQRVRGLNGRVIGLIGTVIRTGVFQQLLDRSVVSGRYDEMAFLDSRLQLLARMPMLSGDAAQAVDDREARAMLARSDSEASYERRSPLDGRSRLYSVRKIDRLPLLVTVGLDKDTLLQGWQLRAWLSLLAWLLVSALAAYCVTRYQQGSRKLEKLAIRSIAVDHAAEAIVIANAEGAVEYVNPAFERLTGLGNADVQGKIQLAELLLAEHPDLKNTMVETLISGDTWRGELASKHRDGHPYHETISVAPVLSPEGRVQYTVAIKHDISDAKLLQAELQRLANTDELTGLYNRRQFMQRTSEEIARSQRWDRPLTLAMLDLDHFKQVNDRYGHPFGDEVLRRFAACCQTTVRLEDVCGRLGGEEFAILLPDTDRYSASQVMERVREAVAALQLPNPLGGMPVQFTVSIGISELYPGDATATPMMARADAALYLAKQEGRNRVRTG
ncbi:diguanylate cyclase [Vogesella sp. LIG4]|uniref:sensor domain-containing diguanylate cyclase n=1 Tax=Vogesella sp. LIG4 TaxID=1192162 RepID=UPI00081FD046|nr:diguanylate cyclase [Vogesella sp. LIG4]SCK13392.1 PAS domain S-box-containing protein/diguanylate cyclase (GGDEF) domain-containing protein [Vogesella sp. LIG4]